MARTPGNRTVDDPDQMEALVSGVRYRIMEVVEKHRALTIREMARHMGMKAVSLYRHVDRLVEVGLLLEAGYVGEGTGEAVCYRSETGTYRFGYEPEDVARTERIVRIIESAHRVSAKEIGAALLSGLATTKGKRRDTTWGQDMGWLDDAQLEELNAHIDAIYRIFDGAVEHREGARQIAMMWSMRALDLGDGVEG